MKTTTKLLVLAFLCIKIHAFAYSNGIISGQVFDQNGLPFELLSVSLISLIDSSWVKTAITDHAGIFLFQNINIGDYLLTIRGGASTTCFSLNIEVREEELHFKLPRIAIENKEEITILSEKN